MRFSIISYFLFVRKGNNKVPFGKKHKDRVNEIFVRKSLFYATF